MNEKIVGKANVESFERQLSNHTFMPNTAQTRKVISSVCTHIFNFAIILGVILIRQKEYYRTIYLSGASRVYEVTRSPKAARESFNTASYDFSILQALQRMCFYTLPLDDRTFLPS